MPPLNCVTMLLNERARIKHCRACGSPVVYLIPKDDNRERAVCPACATVHYENPLNVVGTVPIWGAEVLLCKRAIEPRYGFWTLPAGFLELGETSAEGALRETVEESGAQVDLGPLFSVLDVARVGQVHLFYLATMRSPALDPGSETLEARLFREDEVPWDEIAFRTVRETLRYFFDDRRRGQFGVHRADIG
jgi:ADP-ribose pyrophosphatase YjhB (NUDIX family)